MIDYLEIFYHIQDRLPNQRIELNIMIHMTIIIILLACLFGILIKHKKKKTKYTIISIITLTIFIVLDLFSLIHLAQNYQVTQNDIKKFQTKESLTENITLDDIKYLKLISPIEFDPRTSGLYKNQHYYDSNLNDILQYANIKSIMNFARNISYLHKHYKNIYASESEYEYINKILNEFYNMSQPENIADNDILSKLKN